MTNTVMIVGATGVFGRRLTSHLAATSWARLILTSRTENKAKDLAAQVNADHPSCGATGIALDCAVNLQDVLRLHRPFAVIDCSGPFQGATYDTARAVLKAGAHFIDLADARDYLAGFGPALDELAKRNKVTAMTGASSTPALSSSVVAELVEGWQLVDNIDIAITPGGKSEVGRSVIEAILSYAGRDVPIWENGQAATTRGWTKGDHIRMRGLGKRRVAPVETLDAVYLGERYGVTSRVRFTAGLESRLEQFGIELLANLRGYGLLGELAPLIPWLLKARRITQLWTSDRGGMQVCAAAVSELGQPVHSTWSLLAQDNHGPFVPILAAAAALRKLQSYDLPVGAGFAHRHLSLSEIMAEAHPYNITTGVTHEPLMSCGSKRPAGATFSQKLKRHA